MPIRVVAVDMDGTFLDDNKQYDRAWFARLHKAFAARGGRFVVATGKQYFNAIKLFPQHKDAIGFITENGAQVVYKGETLYTCPVKHEMLLPVAEVVAQFPDINMLLCGEKNAYVLHGQAEYRLAMSNFYEGITEIGMEDIPRLEDPVFKFSLLTEPARLRQNYEGLLAALPAGLTLMSSGFGYLDILDENANKGAALEVLCERWGVPFSGRMAFGDAGNDVALLQRAAYSYAMENADAAVKAVARYNAPSNNDHGVLQVMQQMLDEGW